MINALCRFIANLALWFLGFILLALVCVVQPIRWLIEWGSRDEWRDKDDPWAK